METSPTSSPYNTRPDASRPRSYSGGYMDTGKDGEKIVMDYLKRHPKVRNVQDVTGDKDMQEVEVDVVFEMNGTPVKGEIKTDQHLGVTENVLVEVMRINHTALSEHAITPGWFAKSIADYLFFYAISVKKIYYGKLSDLRTAFQEYSKEARQKILCKIIPTDELKSTVIFLVPFSVFKDVLKIWDLNTKGR